jgi:hypothetical protein
VWHWSSHKRRFEDGGKERGATGICIDISGTTPYCAALCLSHSLTIYLESPKFYACLVCQNRNIYHILKEAQKNRKTNTGC